MKKQDKLNCCLPNLHISDIDIYIYGTTSNLKCKYNNYLLFIETTNFVTHDRDLIGNSLQFMIDEFML